MREGVKEAPMVITDGDPVARKILGDYFELAVLGLDRNHVEKNIQKALAESALDEKSKKRWNTALMSFLRDDLYHETNMEKAVRRLAAETAAE